MRTVALVLFVILSLSGSLLGQTAALGAKTTQPANATAANEKADTFFDFYAKQMRGSLFTGCMTLGSFLLAVHTFVVVNLKKEVYDHPSYQDGVIGIRKEGGTATFFGPLRRLSRLILATIVFAFSTSVAQFTLGLFVAHWVSATVCISFAAITMVLLAGSLVLISLNLRDMFNFVERDAEKKHKTLQAQSSVPAQT